MSLAAIIAHIEAEGETSAAQILARAETQAAQLLAEASSEAARLYAEAEHCAAQTAPGELAHLHNQAAFAALCQVGQARDDLVEQAIEQVRQQLARARQTAEYRQLLARLLAELLPAQLNSHGPDDGWILEADPLDQSILESILANRPTPVSVDYCLVCWGGLSLRASDGRARMLNTLESRLARAMPYLKQELARYMEAGPPSPAVQTP